MISEKDLRSGLIVKARKPRGNMHREFSIWKVGLHWMRFKTDFGEIVGRKDTEYLLRFLNKYEFEIIGEWEVRYYKKSFIRDNFDLDGAL